MPVQYRYFTGLTFWRLLQQAQLHKPVKHILFHPSCVYRFCCTHSLVSHPFPCQHAVSTSQQHHLRCRPKRRRAVNWPNYRPDQPCRYPAVPRFKFLFTCKFMAAQLSRNMLHRPVNVGRSMEAAFQHACVGSPGFHGLLAGFSSGNKPHAVM